MNVNRKLISVLLFLFISMVTLQSIDVTVLADVGNTFSGGGSSSSSSSSSYSSGGSSSGGYSSSYSSSNRNKRSSGSSDVDLPWPLALLFGGIYLIFMAISNSGGENTNSENTNSESIKSEEQKKKDKENIVVRKITKVDENFSRDKFVEYVNMVFIKVQESWEAREWSVIRPFESNELFERHIGQLSEYTENDLYPHLDKQQILSTEIYKYYVDGLYEYITVKQTANIIDYTTDAKGKVVEGSETEYKFRIYKLNFKRMSGVKTKLEYTPSVINCPSCGAPNGINASGKCEFCSSTITVGNYDWVLDEYAQWPNDYEEYRA